jgi:hypothetical protein
MLGAVRDENLTWAVFSVPYGAFGEIQFEPVPENAARVLVNNHDEARRAHNQPPPMQDPAAQLNFDGAASPGPRRPVQHEAPPQQPAAAGNDVIEAFVRAVSQSSARANESMAAQAALMAETNRRAVAIEEEKREEKDHKWVNIARTRGTRARRRRRGRA